MPRLLDEAYLDVTFNKRGIPYAARTAREIRARIFHETGGLTASAGVSYNKFLAKVASDLQKPDGLTIVPPEKADELLHSLPIGRFYGVGKVTEKHFLKLGVKTGGDLRRLSKLELIRNFGKTGEFYYEIARGIDNRPVEPHRERKSLGTEITFQHDMTDLTEMIPVIREQSREVASDLQKRGLAGRTVTVKIKFHDFRTITRSRTLERETNYAELIFDTARELLLASDAGKIPVRLLGVTLSGFPEEETIENPSGIWLQPEFDFGEEL
jgi:DNA polymerase-4